MKFSVVIKVIKTFEEIEVADMAEAEELANELAAEYEGEVISLTAHVD